MCCKDHAKVMFCSRCLDTMVMRCLVHGFAITGRNNPFIFYVKHSITFLSGRLSFGMGCSSSLSQCGFLPACSRDTLL
ncbi:hypothetical protein Y032_0002g903 [Ancylostoma ceylanicum]|uniref:Uncharacterized protein n=1 Tax=Ancylostoma ceylanicum TaxID=53326 RepID=A0A016W1W2_9BILA|nr:hypothetical protein Y032_0002g903 [Ancylostoma ceylanicum]